MRNLIKLATLFAVVLSEADVEQLGFEVEETEFKEYFNITEETPKNEKFHAMDNSEFMTAEEEKEIHDELKKTEAKSKRTKKAIAEVVKKDTAEEEAAKAEKSRTAAKKTGSTATKQTPEEKAAEAAKKSEVKAAEKKKKEEEAAKAKAEKEANATPKQTKEQKWEILKKEYVGKFKEGDKLHFIDYKTKERVECTFKKDSCFGDKMPAALVALEKGTKLVSYPNLNIS